LKQLNGHWSGLLGESHTRAILEQVLRLSPADETEAALETQNAALTRFAHNVIHQNVSETQASLEVRVAFGRRVGAADTNDLSPGGIERAVAQACALAQHLPDSPDWPGLADPVPPAGPSGPQPVLAFDEAVAGMTPAARAQTVAKVSRAARGEQLLASGAFSSSHGESAVANSHGLFAYAPATEIDLTFVVEQPDVLASAYGHAAGWQLAQVGVDDLALETVRRAKASRRPRPVPAGEYPVVLDPYAVASLLESLAEAGMGALAVQEERSWMNGRLGRRCLSPELTIIDDAYDPSGLPQAFDCEGVPKQRVSIVVDGIPISPVYDRLTAARETGRSSTGHAQPYADEDWDGPLPDNLSLLPGELSIDEMLARIDRGLYVTRLWYVNLLSPHDCTVTGMTRDGVWWIENGELAHPVENLRFDQSLVGALARLRGVGRERRTVAGFFGGVHQVPALALDSFRFVAP
jgi:predicted Zn-dependent protease